MIQVEHIETWGFGHAIRGMRNPMNSHAKSDSHYEWGGVDFSIGTNDLNLMQRLYKAGPEHRKYMRQIFVSMDITAPLYWWKEYDTYKVGTTANSCSTMHKITAKEFSYDDFSVEHIVNGTTNCDPSYGMAFDSVLRALNEARHCYLDTKDKTYWWQIIQLLPSSYNQKRTVTMNYENAVNMIKQRTGHKLDEWNEFVKVLEGLPYMKDITENEKTL